MNQLLGNTDTVKKIITWSSQFSENFLEVGVIFLSVSSFCNPNATHFFCSKNINVFENTLATTVNQFVINKLVKLTMLPELKLHLSMKILLVE